MTRATNSFEDIPDQFWDLISLAQKDREQFRTRVKQMSREELSDFYWTHENAAAELKGPPYVDYMSPDLSEDNIDDVAMSVVGQGKDYYAKILKNPELTPHDAPGSPGIVGIVVKEYYDRFGEAVPFPDRKDW
jgi:hypothetical protein